MITKRKKPESYHQREQSGRPSAVRNAFEAGFVELLSGSGVDVSLSAGADHEKNSGCIAYGSLVQLVHF